MSTNPYSPEDESLYRYWYEKALSKSTKDAFIAGRHSGDVKHVKSKHVDGKTVDVFDHQGEQFEVERK